MNFLVDALSRLPQHDRRADPIVTLVFSPSQLGLAAVTRSQASVHSSIPGGGIQAGLEEDPEFLHLKPDFQIVNGMFVKGGRL